MNQAQKSVLLFNTLTVNIKHRRGDNRHKGTEQRPPDNWFARTTGSEQQSKGFLTNKVEIQLYASCLRKDGAQIRFTSEKVII